MGPAWSAETEPELATGKTQLVVKLATDETLSIRSRFQDEPPTIVIEFPPERVVGVLPERSKIQRGVIEAIATSYAPGKQSAETRWIQRLSIQLRRRYPFHVTAERGRIVVEIEHPADVVSEAVEVGVGGAAVIVGARPFLVSERFRAMEAALDQAHPLRWMWQASSEPAGPLERANASRSIPATTVPQRSSAAPSPSSPPQRAPSSQAMAMEWLWAVLGIGLAVAGIRWLRRYAHRVAARRASRQSPPRLPSAVHVIDQLVWRAFERQGYQLLQTEPLAQPLGVMRVILKEDVKTALLVVGEERFLEKTAVERFASAMHAAQLQQGTLVAAGSFTVPAHRWAKAHRITLIGRDQLTELLSDGIMNEQAIKQLQQLQSQLDEAKNALSQYAQQMDVLRRQRNEASWFLGQERAQTAKLQAQVSELTEQIRHWQVQAEQWEQTAQRTQKQWEESEWYLGEARAVARHLEEQLTAIQASSAQLEERQRALLATLQDTERQRHDAESSLGESRAAQESWRQHVEQLNEQLARAQDRLNEMQRAVDEAQRRLQEERTARQLLEAEGNPRAAGERRKTVRVFREDLTIEVQRPGDGAVLFRGSPLNVSRTGLGFQIQDLSDEFPDSLTIRLALPGWDQPLEATSRVVWQRHDPLTNNRLVGCELHEIPEDSRHALEQVLAPR
ncbi:MAG: PilZ domain-containing protein [Candidatus Omnitrophica bacterium]|nr:PilZ domain-containing protein [Candidatus Omnitrophota bacterium]